MGAVQTVDTACSSTLVSANILHSNLRKKEHAEYLELMKSNGAAKELLAFAKDARGNCYLHV